MATIFRTDGKIEIIKPANGTDFTLTELKKIVNGYIEILPIGENLLMVCNEEGKLMGLPVNENASLAVLDYGIIDIIVGDVLICRTDEIR